MSLTPSLIKQQAQYIRKQAAVFLTDEVTLYRKLGESVVDGDRVVDYDEGEQIPCRFIVRSGSSASNIPAQERVPAQLVYTGAYRLQLPFGTVIDVEDKLVFQDVATGTLREFEITYIPPFHDMMGAFVIGIQDIQ